MYNYKEYSIAKSANSPGFDLTQTIEYVGEDGGAKRRVKQISFDMSLGYCINRIIGIELGKSKDVKPLTKIIEDLEKVSADIEKTIAKL